MSANKFDTDYEKQFNKCVRESRAAAKGFFGIERAEKIRDYFSEKTDHPHPGHTFTQMQINRTSNHQFPIDLMKDLSNLVAVNKAM